MLTNFYYRKWGLFLHDVQVYQRLASLWRAVGVRQLGVARWRLFPSGLTLIIALLVIFVSGEYLHDLARADRLLNVVRRALLRAKGAVRL